MVKGSCGCGNVTWEVTGEPKGFAACHCIPCRKSSGTGASWNLMVPDDDFAPKSGNTRTWSRKGSSGKTVTNHYCDTCFAFIYVEAEAMAGLKLVKGGLVDDKAWLGKVGKPKVEIFCRNMADWEEKIPGADHFDASM